MKATFKIRRFDPQKNGGKEYWKSYDVDVEPTDRVVDGLNTIKWFIDGTLAFRRSCIHGVCGSDAMVINGRNRLACKVLVKQLRGTIRIEPLRGFRVIKDLVVDMEPFFEKYRSVRPYLMTDEPEPSAERVQSVEDRERFDDTTKCILCAACTTACPSFWANDSFIGPASIVQAHRFLFDSRDTAMRERLRLLGTRQGVWRCRTVFNCYEACPRDIDVTRAIEEVKRLWLRAKI